MPASVELVRGDITALSVDAIVNAEECDRIGRCETGDAVVTGGGDLPAKWVIHAVGPVWQGGGSGEEDLLASAVESALKRAEEIGARSVALPALSTGVYGFPIRRAAEISIREARRFAAGARSLEKILFCLFDDRALAAFEEAAAG